MSRYLLGIDLHGTLLDETEEFPSQAKADICALLNQLHDICIPVTCTGNDISFVEKKLPDELMNQLHGHVLETGCTFCDSRSKNEIVYVSKEIVEKRNQIEETLKSKHYPEVTRFGRRLATVSLFTPSPPDFASTISTFLQAHNHNEFVATYSSVAVDIIPRGFDKLKGLRQAAKGKKVIGIADSVNDIPLLEGADIAFSPSNLAPQAEKTLRESGKSIDRISPSIDSLKANTIYKANRKDAFGVIEILDFLHRIFHRN